MPLRLAAVRQLLRNRLHAGVSWWAAQHHHVVGVLLLLGAWVTFYGYTLAPPEHWADLWNIGGALGRLLLVGLLVLAYRSAPVIAGALWWVFEDAQVVGCTAWWMIRPWPVDVGHDQCSAALGVPMGLAGLSLGGVLAWVVFRSVQVSNDDPA